MVLQSVQAAPQLSGTNWGTKPSTTDKSVFIVKQNIFKIPAQHKHNKQNNTYTMLLEAQHPCLQ